MYTYLSYSDPLVSKRLQGHRNGVVDEANHCEDGRRAWQLSVFPRPDSIHVSLLLFAVLQVPLTISPAPSTADRPQRPNKN